MVSQDGFLRVFHYDTMELIGRARSYFGGFLCVCWSPDGKYVVVGGEDDLVTVWSFSERRVVARGQGHRSWVSVVAFDPYIVSFTDPENEVEDEKKSESVQCYRLGSVSQDTQLCLWDLTEDVLRPPVRARASAHLSPNNNFSPNGIPGTKVPKCPKTNKIGHKHAELSGNASGEPSGAKPAAKAKANNVSTLNISVGKAKEESSGSLGVNFTQRLAGFSFGERRSEHRRNFSLTKPAEKTTNTVALRGKSAQSDGYDPVKLIGTPSCPRFDECPVLEPLVCKKIAHERLTALLFRAEYLVTACADGCVNTWARPARPRPRDSRDPRPDSRDPRPDSRDPRPDARDRIDLVD